eukprot:2740483-Prymnesium_polylepis.1
MRPIEQAHVTSSNPFGDNTSVPVPACTSGHTTTPANPRFFLHRAESIDLHVLNGYIDSLSGRLGVPYARP